MNFFQNIQAFRRQLPLWVQFAIVGGVLGIIALIVWITMEPTTEPPPEWFGKMNTKLGWVALGIIGFLIFGTFFTLIRWVWKKIRGTSNDVEEEQ